MESLAAGIVLFHVFFPLHADRGFEQHLHQDVSILEATSRSRRSFKSSVISTVMVAMFHLIPVVKKPDE